MSTAFPNDPGKARPIMREAPADERRLAVHPVPAAARVRDAAAHPADKTTGQRHELAAARPSREQPPPHERIDLEPLLDAIQEFGTASLELMAWEFGLPEGSLRGHWELCIEEQLITRDGIDPIVGETMYRLTAQGTARLPPAAHRPPPGS